MGLLILSAPEFCYEWLISPIFPPSILFRFLLLVLQGFVWAGSTDWFFWSALCRASFLGWMIVPSWLLLLLLNRSYEISLDYVYTLVRFCMRQCELHVAPFPGGLGSRGGSGIDSVAIAMSFFLMTLFFHLGVSMVTVWGEYLVIVPYGIILHWDASVGLGFLAFLMIVFRAMFFLLYTILAVWSPMEKCSSEGLILRVEVLISGRFP